MPWHVEPNSPDCPAETPWAVVADDTEEVMGCHATEAEANDQVAALYANEPNASATVDADDAVMTAVYDAWADPVAARSGNGSGVSVNFGAIGPHSTATDDGAWDGPANEARLPSPMTEATARAAYAWMAEGAVTDGMCNKTDCRFIHHVVSADGSPGAASTAACSTGIGVLNGGRGGTTIPDADVQGVYDHLAKHLRDAGQEPPELMRAATTANSTTFAVSPTQAPPADQATPPPANAEWDPLRYSKGLWRGVLAVETVETGDWPRREFAADSLTWREPPLSIYWQKVTADEHNNSFIVARADELRRDPAIPTDAGTVAGVRAHGRFNLDDPQAREVHAMIGQQFIRGISVTLDDIEDADVEYVFPEAAPEGDAAAALDLTMPEKVIFHHARIMDACLTGQPALPEAYVELVADDDEASLTDDRPVLTAGGYPVRPPSAWFRDPKLDGPTPATFLDSGRCFGHLAIWGTCHLSFAPKMCVTPPRGSDYKLFRHGTVVTAEGDQFAVGQVTMGTIHAPASLGVTPAVQHYEHTGHAIADVAIGEDRYGIWMAGALRPDVTESQLRALRAGGWSGDWRKERGGAWQVAGALAVNVPGFPIPRVRTYTVDGEQTALVASGLIIKPPSNVIPIGVADRIARSIGRDHPSRRAELRARVHPKE